MVSMIIAKVSNDPFGTILKELVRKIMVIPFDRQYNSCNSSIEKIRVQAAGNEEVT